MATRYLTIKEAAARLNVSHDTVGRLIDRAELPAIRISERIVRIPVPAFERYERGVPVATKRVVRRRVATGVAFGAGERVRDLEVV